jgi:hypothetical protein
MKDDRPITKLVTERWDLSRLVESIKAVVYEHTGTISVTEAIGALELAKLEIMQEQQ